MDPVKRGLFINNKKAKDSIFESGYMVYRCLLNSDKFALDYCEVDAIDRTINTGYDFYLFNFHPVTMGWLDTGKLKKHLGFVGTIILEVAPNDPFVFCSSTDFTFYCVLDPTIKSTQKNVFVFPRPLEDINFQLPLVANPVPVIGTFGFATKGKGFHHVVEAVNKEFTKAIVKINIPFGDFVPESRAYASYLADVCKKTAKPGIDVIVSHDFMNKEELIRWCASNTLNCFLYDRDMPGLAATTDQAIVSGQPLSVSDNDTFRHILQYLKPYPALSLKESIDNSRLAVKKMQEDWSSGNFAKKFEKIVTGKPRKTKASPPYKPLTLPIKKFSLIDTINIRVKKYKRKLKKLNFRDLFSKDDQKRSKKII